MPRKRERGRERVLETERLRAQESESAEAHREDQVRDKHREGTEEDINGDKRKEQRKTHEARRKIQRR